MSNKTALLIIDAQVGILEGMLAYRWDEVVGRIADLLTLAHSSGTPVIYVQHSGVSGHRLDPAGSGWAIHPAIQPLAGELVVHKRECDSFFETTLEQELRSRGIGRLIVAGCMTQYCIDTACRRAVSLGYDVTLVADAHTTADTDALGAAQIVAHHNDLLDGFSAGEHSIQVLPAADIEFIAQAV